MTSVSQLLVGSVPSANLYALIGVGFVTVYRSSRVLNFAQGQMALLGAYLFYSLVSLVGGRFYVGLVLACLVALVIGTAIYVILLRPAVGQGPLILIMLTIILGIVIESFYTVVWHTDVRFLSNPFGQAAFHLPGDAVISELTVATAVVAVVLIGGFAIFVHRSRWGIAMRASAENPGLASFRGVNVSATAAVSWAVAMLMATVAGVAYGTRTSLDPTLVGLGLSTFPAILIGGLDSIGGVLIGSVVLAVIQNAAATYLGGNWTDVVAYLVLLAVLVIRPTGLFGTRSLERL